MFYSIEVIGLFKQRSHSLCLKIVLSCSHFVPLYYSSCPSQYFRRSDEKAQFLCVLFLRKFLCAYGLGPSFLSLISSKTFSRATT